MQNEEWNEESYIYKQNEKFKILSGHQEEVIFFFGNKLQPKNINTTQYVSNKKVSFLQLMSLESLCNNPT